MTEGLRVLVVDDETPALDELAWLLRRDHRVTEVHATDSPTDALKLLQQFEIDAVFLDVKMPGLNGVELGTIISRFANAPATVFVTAHEEHAVEAFDLNAVDYVLKPVREERLREAVRRITTARGAGASTDDTIPVALGGVTRFVNRSEIAYVEAQGDYARLHTATGSHLVRLPLSALEERWADAGFIRIHRSLLVSLAQVDEVRVDDGHCTVVVAGRELRASRRQSPMLREMLRKRRQGTSEAES
jgi:DNA-binding LytR/AlgR family response regulator